MKSSVDALMTSMPVDDSILETPVQERMFQNQKGDEAPFNLTP